MPEFRLSPDDIAAIKEAVKPEPPPPTKARHEFLNPDFWFMAATFCFLVAASSTHTPRDYLELCWIGATVCSVVAMLCNIQRDKVQVEAKPARQRQVQQPVRSSVSPLRQAQIDAGIRLVEHLKSAEPRERRSNVH